MRYSYRLIALFSLFMALPAAGKAQAPVPEEPRPALPNYVELTPRIGTGGQPSDAGMKQLAAEGYRYIINIRASGEKVDFAAEEKQAIDLGLRYIMVPFSAREPSEGQALAFTALMSGIQDSRVFVHCGSGARAGSLMMIYFVLGEGQPPEKAEAEAKKVGLRSPELLEFAKQVIDRHKK
jgi:uncharacterized protein (TIGR01244 family)